MTVVLLRSTGDQRADRALQLAIDRLDAAFPGRIRSCYLSGSFAEAAAVPTSDIDALVIFKGGLQSQERERFQRLTRRCSRLTGTMLDLAVRGEAEFHREGGLPAKMAARVLLLGDEIRNQIPAMPVDQYVQRIIEGSVFYLGLVRGGAEVLVFPLSYPDPCGEFYGYERRGYRDIGGWQRAGTKALVGGVTLAATALVAMQTGRCVVKQSDSVMAYRDRINDDWADLIDAIYECCKIRWAYSLPAGQDERQQLRDLCRCVLGFENHYLLVCKRYLLACLRSADDRSKGMARRLLRHVMYLDDVVVALQQAQENTL